MPLPYAAIAMSLAIMFPAPVHAVDTSMQLVISLSGDAERRLTRYQCEETMDLVTVEYIDAAPNFLAVTAVDGEKRIFVQALAASGVRYVSGQYVWWTKGAEASLYDEMAGPDAPALATCLEANEIP